MPNKSRFFGDLPARYNFFLNPYSDVRFTRCPQCEGKTSQKKVPLVNSLVVGDMQTGSV